MSTTAQQTSNRLGQSRCASNVGAQRDVNRAVVERMADAIRHRGPEDDGVFTEKAITVAHLRLKILGLYDGQQPIYNED